MASCSISTVPDGPTIPDQPSELSRLEILPLAGIPELREGDDLATLLGDAIERAGGLEDGDVVVVAQKAVSKAEGRGARVPVDRHVDAILGEAARVAVDAATSS